MKCLANALQRTGSDFCATNNFQGIFAHFRSMIFIQERINIHVDPCLLNLQLLGVFQMPLSMCHLVIVENFENS